MVGIWAPQRLKFFFVFKYLLVFIYGLVTKANSEILIENFEFVIQKNLVGFLIVFFLF